MRLGRVRRSRLRRLVLESLEPKRLLSADLDPSGSDRWWGGSTFVEPANVGASESGSMGNGSGGIPTALQAGGGSGFGTGSGGGGNLRITDAYLRDGRGVRIDAPVIGELIAVQVHFETSQLPADASYHIDFRVNGVSLGPGAQTVGAGQAAGVWFASWSGWYASPEVHSVEVVLDPQGTLPETDETDNAAQFSFTPVTASFPQPLIWPAEGSPNVVNAFTNYIDVDPTPGIRDFNGGSFSYNGHDAWDLGPGLFVAQDAGIEVYAAAAGTVIDLDDGHFDRHEAWLTPAPKPNYVVIDHGNGWTTTYVHLRRDSLRVEIGESVTAGQVLGYMGSSGTSDGTHLHFGLRRHGFPVEPMYDPATYLADPPPYVGEVKTLLHAGITNRIPTPHINERPSNIDAFDNLPNQRVIAWGYFAGLEAGDVLQFRWIRPDGRSYATNPNTIVQSFAQSWWWLEQFLPVNPDLGEWKVEFYVTNGLPEDAGTKLGETRFLVAESGAPEIRIEDASGDILLNRRFTPVDFGSAARLATPPTHTFRVVNHGEAPLPIGSLSLPSGFTLIDGLAASIPAGGTDTFTVALETDTAGYFGGVVRLESGDADEPLSWFSVEGLVEQATSASLVLGLSRRDSPEGTEVIGHVRRVGAATNLAVPLTVALASSDSSEAAVPPSVVIPAGRAFASFPITLPLDNLEDGSQDVTITASSATTSPATNHLEVLNVSLPLDFGDAPQGYPTTIAENGPSHFAVGPRLGSLRDAEPDGSHSAAANADDLNGSADEDGVTFGAIQIGSEATVTVDVQNTDTAKLDAWIDFNRDGILQPSEKIFSSREIAAGLHPLSFPVPVTASAGFTLARFRLSSEGQAEATGFATDGEVEDHWVQILPPPPRVESVSINGGNPQRSSLEQVAIQFDAEVTIEDAVVDPFSVRHRESGAVVPHVRDTTVNGGKTVVTLTFPDRTAVVDGNYEVLIDAALVRRGPALLDGDGNGQGGDDFAFGKQSNDEFFRWYGDVTGDGHVNLLDFTRFRGSFGRSESDPGYEPGFDSDGSGQINLLDFTAFRGKFGRSRTWN